MEIAEDADSAWASDAAGIIYTADILLGADGHRSMVRSSMVRRSMVRRSMVRRSMVRRSIDPEHPDARHALIKFEMRNAEKFTPRVRASRYELGVN